jgi:hypothetical protein
MVGPSGRGLKEDESAKLERSVKIEDCGTKS